MRALVEWRNGRVEDMPLIIRFRQSPRDFRRKLTFCVGPSSPTAGTHHRQLTQSLIAAPTRAAGRRLRGRHALSRHPVLMIQVAITSDTRKNSKVIERLMPKCISDFSKKLQRKPLIR